MLPKTMVVLAITLVLAGSALSSSAFARASGRDGGGGLARGGSRDHHFAGASASRRAAGGGHGGYGGRVSGMRGQFRGDRRGDVWHHWGDYYGPMISIP